MLKPDKKNGEVYKYIHIWIKDSSPLVFYTFPMVHVGLKEYYNRLNQHFNNLNHILYEGIGKQNEYKPKKDIYRPLARSLGLVTQWESLKIPEDINKINIDITPSTFYKKLLKLPLKDVIFLTQYRLLTKIFLIFPKVKAFFKESLDRILSIQDYRKINPIYIEKYYDNPYSSKLTKLLVNERNSIFRKKILDYINANELRPFRLDVGIVAGSAHMLAICNLLNTQDYKWKLLEEIRVL
jgi:hypothetical protein